MNIPLILAIYGPLAFLCYYLSPAAQAMKEVLRKNSGVINTMPATSAVLVFSPAIFAIDVVAFVKVLLKEVLR